MSRSNKSNSSSVMVLIEVITGPKLVRDSILFVAAMKIYSAKDVDVDITHGKFQMSLYNSSSRN